MSRTIEAAAATAATAAACSSHGSNSSSSPQPLPRPVDAYGISDERTDDASDEQSYPSRCESPLLPMGQTASYQIDPDRLSQQLGKHGHRQSQHSVAYKNYALRDDDDDDGIDGAGGPSALRNSKTGFQHGLATAGSRRANAGLSTETRGRYYMRRPKTLLRPKSYRIGGGPSAEGGQTSPVKEFSSKIKSACRKLNPKRLTKSGSAAQRDGGSLQNDTPHDGRQAQPADSIGLGAASPSAR